MPSGESLPRHTGGGVPAVMEPVYRLDLSVAVLKSGPGTGRNHKRSSGLSSVPWECPDPFSYVEP